MDNVPGSWILRRDNQMLPDLAFAESDWILLSVATSFKGCVIIKVKSFVLKGSDPDFRRDDKALFNKSRVGVSVSVAEAAV